MTESHFATYLPVSILVILVISGINVFTSTSLIHLVPTTVETQQMRISNTNSPPATTTSLECLTHKPQDIPEGWKIKGGMMVQNTSQICGTLRRDWSQHLPRSEMAKWLHEQQSDCSKPIATHHLDNTYGLGSHLILWGQALCNAIEQGNRMQSIVTPKSEFPLWIWMDQEYCSGNKDDPLLCYFPSLENHASSCLNRTESGSPNVLVKDPRAYRCDLVNQNITSQQRGEYRTAATEYLFSSLNPIIIREAQRQMGIVFAESKGRAPSNLITVHIRWGDKFWEMDLPKVDEYIDAVHSLTKNSNFDKRRGVHIYLATEDPMALEEFLKFAPSSWHIYPDITLHEINDFRPIKGNRASHATRNTKGRAGLVALGSLLVSMESNFFVLTTKSNWSTMIDHLRKAVLNDECGNCTEVVDLRPDVW